MCLQIGEFIGVKKILIRLRACRARDIVGKIGISVEIALRIVDFEFAAFAVAICPIELGQDRHVAELAVVEHVFRALVIKIESHRETGRYDLIDAEIEIIGALGLNRIGLLNIGLHGGAVEQRKIGLCRLCLIGRGKIS
jgi:hypothetical protein